MRNNILPASPMRYLRPLLYFILFFSRLNAQEVNLDMESLSADRKPLQWKAGLQEGQEGMYLMTVDSIVKHSGKYALKISGSNPASTYTSAYIQLPSIYNGKKITLKGFLKTEGVRNGFAGLFMSLETSNYVYLYDNMKTRNITGDNEWKEYKIEFRYSPEVKQINFGGMLAGQGTIWIDDLSISIDDEPITKAKRKSTSPADLDSTFDKGSGISIALTPFRKRSLNIFGQVWGFLKYHHPAVASGNINWDGELLRELPRILSLTSNQELMNELTTWIDKYPRQDSCQSCNENIDTGKVAVYPDYGDLFKQGFLSDGIKNKLLFLLKNLNVTSQYYVEPEVEAGNAKLKNERLYQYSFPDDGIRLVSLYRYWAAVQYYYPFRNSIGQNWSKVLPELIPMMLNAKDSTTYYSACLKMVSKIHDTHAVVTYDNLLKEKFFGSYFTGFTTKIIQGNLVVDELLSNDISLPAKISRGDIIYKVNETPIEKIIDSLKIFFSESTKQALLRDVNPYLLRGKSNTVNVTVTHAGKVQTIILPRYQLSEFGQLHKTKEIDSCYKILPDNIGYLYAGNYKNSYLPDIRRAFVNTKGIIIDMRCYPMEFMPYTFGNFIKNYFSIFVRFSNIDFKHPGLFTFQRIYTNGNEEEKSYNGKIVILVNELTQSQAEFTTMAFQSITGAKVIGSPTAGTDGNTTKISLPGGVETWITGVGVFYPDRTPTQNIGVKIDIPVTPTLQGFINRKDEILETAVEYLKKK